MNTLAPANAEEKTYLTVDEFADILRVTPTTIRRFIRSGHIPAIKLGNKWRIPASFSMPEHKPVPELEQVPARAQSPEFRESA